jgi:glycosyltransferase involved in cell wall biosynthesis
MKLSIVIPVFKVEKYLSRCLDSCINQNISKEEYEIIIVNDGSPDGSKAIAEKYVEENTNIKLINQENRGLSIARNNGLKVAQGKYVWFVDSDDWIAENCLYEIVKEMESQNLDLLQIGYFHAYEDGTTQTFEKGMFDGCKSGSEVMKTTFIPIPAPFTIYKREFLISHALAFYPGIYHEDAEFKPRAVFLAERFASLHRHVYFYYQRSNGSIMSHYSVKLGLDKMTACSSLCTFEESVSMDNDMKKEFNYIITALLNPFFKGMTSLNKDEQKILIDTFRSKKNLLQSIKHSKSFTHRLEGWLLSINIPMGIKIINFLR